MTKMPVLFIGHGSPMNAVEDNRFTRKWSEIALQIPVPKAILCVSAHWYTPGSRITDALRPTMVYDMYGFPEELYKVKYNAPGAPELAHLTQNLIGRNVQIDNSWGCDHGTWSVLCKMYPEAEMPVYQLSIDRTAEPSVQYQIGKEISALRDSGVLILGSGNVVHNLSRISWNMDGGYPWAVEFDACIRDRIIVGDYSKVVDWRSAGKSSEVAFHTPDHFYPLLYVLGAAGEDGKVTVFNDACVNGSLSMTSFLIE